MKSLPAFGLTMNHSTPARWAPPSGFSAVSSAPHSLPLANVTCCMRVSFESGREMTSLPGAPTSSLQQPRPAMVNVVVLLMQWPCGAATPGAVPEPGCCCAGGMAYWPTLSTLLLRLRLGEAELSEPVFCNAQTTNWLDV